jgi:prepilin-type N-terminal cleavage/methylation domain-containing protein
VKKKGFSLMELLIVILIIGVLAVLFLPNFRPARESALDDEVRANLKLIQSAEKVYKLDYNTYYPADDTTDNIADINQYLKLALPRPVPLIWNYTITADAANFNVVATRNIPDASRYGRSWQTDRTLEEPACTNIDDGNFCR